MPVFPDVGSRIVCPGASAPRSSASSIRARATRSLTDPVGLWDSSLAQMRTPGLGERRLSSTSGVLPIAWMMSPYRPPHGRFCSSCAIASGSVVASGNVVERRIEGAETLPLLPVRLDPPAHGVYPTGGAHARRDGLGRVREHASRDAAEQRGAVGGALLDREPLDRQLEHGGDDPQPQL